MKYTIHKFLLNNKRSSNEYQCGGTTKTLMTCEQLFEMVASDFKPIIHSGASHRRVVGHFPLRLRIISHLALEFPLGFILYVV